MDVGTLLILATTLLVGVLLGVLVGWSLARAQRGSSSGDDVVASLTARVEESAVVKEGLERLGDQLRDLEHNRATWQGQLHQQVLDMRHTTDLLRRETSSLATALRKPQVRGRWGELHLRRAVELAGLVDRVDFSEQVRLEDGALRPDLVVHLVGGRSVVVDAKVSLEGFLDATAAEEDDEREAHLRRHGRQVRTHVDQLASKGYWEALDSAPEFVVLFLPAESVLAAALEADPSLLEHAAAKQVVLASPTTLIALLRTVAQGWRHEALAEQTREVHRLGRELHRRLGTLGGHLDSVGRSLNAAVGHYNAAIGSLESRVLVSARRFEEQGVTEEHLTSPRPVDLQAVARRGTDHPGQTRPSVGLEAVQLERPEEHGDQDQMREADSR
ncbi:DNA recombination protein RmuC [Nocardioides bruguierae]|uniref:DNA recombination protein RmuC n=1 Tax=Nocardioides bruguierae TaxID=2945102 RepID=A0A9X2IGI0_9ACTN|nr:DNA recombination protein RmuC [Nocardioides bruguierae]MCM0622043.1 DNA recombination protein RmuC [Nocardioides bruguierae]